MGKTITIDEEAYKTLVSLKEEPGDSFSKVIRRHLCTRLETAGEILAWEESHPPANADPEVLELIKKSRGRRSGGRK